MHFKYKGFPTNPFTNLELLNQSHDVSEPHKIRRSADLEALNLWKGSLGCPDCVQVEEENLEKSSASDTASETMATI